MGELEKYGLLSLFSLVVLCLVLTFARRDLPPDDWTADGDTLRPPPTEPLVPLVAPARAAPDPSPHVVPIEPEAVAAPTRAPDVVDEAAASLREVDEEEVEEEPIAAPAVDAAPNVPERIHVVRPGETLSDIALAELGSARRWPEILALNGVRRPEELRAGQRLLLPPSPAAPSPPPARGESVAPPRPQAGAQPTHGRRHRVSRGDTLWSIARRHYGDARRWKRIWLANRDRVPDPARLPLGVWLDLP